MKVAIAILLATTLASATTYYVAKNGNDGDPGTEARPWLTVGKCVNIVVAGDTVLVKAGIYDEAIVDFRYNSGTAADPIVIKSFDGWNTIIHAAVQFCRPHYIMEGFKLVLDSGDENAHGVMFNHVGDPGSDSCTLRDCELTATGIFRANGVYVGLMRGVVIDNNTIHGFGDDINRDHGIYIQGTSCTITDNIVYNNTSCGIHLAFESPGPSVDSNLVAYNVCYDNLEGILIKGNHNWIHDNISYGNTNAGIMPYGGIGHGNEYSNNVVYGNGVGILMCGTGANVLRNNVVLNNTMCLNEYNIGTGTVIDYNCYYPDGPYKFYTLAGGYMSFTEYQAFTGQEAHGILADPLFVDTTAHNFRLGDTSRCIDKGDSATTPGYDFDGVWRPQGAVADMGVYEHVAAPVPVVDVGVTRILAPTGTVDSGATVTPQAWVGNYGSMAATFPVTFTIGSFYTNTQNVSNLAPGDSALVSFAAWNAVQVGTHGTRCSTALSGDVVPANDTLSGTVTVRSASVIDVGVTRILAPTGKVPFGTIVTPRARVKNFGTAAASFPVTFTIGSVYSNSQTVSSLAPGDSVLVSFAIWKASPRGAHYVTRCLTALPGDQNPSNDMLLGSVTVRGKAGLATFDVFDVTGRVVLTQAMVAGRTPDLRKLKAGVYLVKVTTEGFSTTQKIVKHH